MIENTTPMIGTTDMPGVRNARGRSGRRYRNTITATQTAHEREQDADVGSARLPHRLVVC